MLVILCLYAISIVFSFYWMIRFGRLTSNLPGRKIPILDILTIVIMSLIPGGNLFFGLAGWFMVRVNS